MFASSKTDSYSKLKAYFEYLMKVTPAKESAVVFSPPYVDAWGLGKKAKNIDFILLPRPHCKILCLYTRHHESTV